MAKHTTHKRSKQGREVTIQRKQIRALKVRRQAPLGDIRQALNIPTARERVE